MLHQLRCVHNTHMRGQMKATTKHLAHARRARCFDVRTPATQKHHSAPAAPPHSTNPSQGGICATLLLLGNCTHLSLCTASRPCPRGRAMWPMPKKRHDRAAATLCLMSHAEIRIALNRPTRVSGLHKVMLASSCMSNGIYIGTCAPLVDSLPLRKAAQCTGPERAVHLPWW